MKKLKSHIFRLASTLLSLTLLLTSALPAFAQSEVVMADTFRAEGKIYVVVAVILLIFAGIVAYMIRIDRKLSRVEKELDIND